MKHTLLLILLGSLFLSVSSFAQTQTADFDFAKAEQVIEAVMQQQIDDPETQEQACAIASLVGVYQFRQHRFEAAAKTLEYAISHSRQTDGTLQIQNHVFLIHALCLNHDRKALSWLQRLVPMLQDLQRNTVRGDFPVEHADGMRSVMNNLLLPLSSLVSRSFPDDETLGYCFNLMLFLKQFAFHQLAGRKQSDLKHSLFLDYRKLLAAQLRTGEVVIEFVPCMDIDQGSLIATNYVAYLLDHEGQVELVEVCNKADVETLFLHNESPWLLYKSTRLSALVWERLVTHVAGKQRIYLSPCGILNRVNFLLLDDRIYELTSASELLKTYPVNSHADALLIGDIDYDQSIVSTIRSEREWGRLSATKIEIESIAKTLSPHYALTKLTHDTATETAVMQLCNHSPQILHFATHAICYTDSLRRSQQGFFDFPYDYNPERPELTFCGLVLSGGNLGFRLSGNRPLNNDGILLSDEISKLRLDSTTLVVLSACNSANGVFDDIEGTFGLVKAFKLAGAKTIIASLSKVDDNATSEFMSYFYHRLSTNESLHDAFLATITHMKDKYPARPKFWTSFKMIDSW